MNLQGPRILHAGKGEAMGIKDTLAKLEGIQMTSLFLKEGGNE